MSRLVETQTVHMPSSKASPVQVLLLLLSNSGACGQTQLANDTDMKAVTHQCDK
jgi:hypothetical protein